MSTTYTLKGRPVNSNIWFNCNYYTKDHPQNSLSQLIYSIESSLAQDKMNKTGQYQYKVQINKIEEISLEEFQKRYLKNEICSNGRILIL